MRPEDLLLKHSAESLRDHHAPQGQLHDSGGSTRQYAWLQMKAEHSSERDAFRKNLLGGRRA